MFWGTHGWLTIARNSAGSCRTPAGAAAGLHDWLTERLDRGLRRSPPNREAFREVPNWNCTLRG